MDQLRKNNITLMIFLLKYVIKTLTFNNGKLTFNMKIFPIFVLIFAHLNNFV